MRILTDVDDLPRNTRACIYDASKAGIALKELLGRLREDIEIAAFIDEGNMKECHGLAVVHPNEIAEINAHYDHILIASDKWYMFEKEVDSKYLSKCLVASRHLYHPVISDLFEKEEVIKYWMSVSGIFTRQEMASYKGQFSQVRSLLFSDEDRTLYDVLIESRSIVPNMNILIKHYLENFIDTGNQYLEFINKRCIKTVIDGGFDDGKTALTIFNHLKQNAIIYAFEPDDDNYSQCTSRKIIDKVPNIRTFKAALWKEKAKLCFMEGSKESAGRVINGEQSKRGISVDAVSIDEFVREHDIRKVDLIKLDVEGAEMEVLEGANATLTTHRPQLAISIYHKKEHLIQIPLHLNRILNGYIYRLGSYHPSPGEKILYAIPKEVSGDDTDRHS